MRCRNLLVLSVAMALPLASGCASRTSEPSQRIGPLASAHGAPVVVFACLAPGRMPPGSGAPSGPAQVGGGEGPFRFDSGFIDTARFICEELPFHDAGVFVSEPAFGGAVVFFFPGYVLGWVPAPFAMLFGDKDWRDLPVICGFFAGGLGYFAVGGPLWAVKKVVWDGPCAFGRFANLHLRSRKGQVDYLVRRLDGYDGGLWADASDRLGELTGARFYDKESWLDWWPRHRDEFDSKMRRVKPAPAPRPVPTNA